MPLVQSSYFSFFYHCAEKNTHLLLSTVASRGRLHYRLLSQVFIVIFKGDMAGEKKHFILMVSFESVLA